MDGRGPQKPVSVDGRLCAGAMNLPLASQLLSTLLLLAQAQTPVFKVDTNLQSVAVQVTDRQGTYVPGLTASEFTLLEDGRPQKIAFFEAQTQPISLAILLDVGRSMDFGGKLERALGLLAPLMRGNLPEDEIFFMPFTDEAGPFHQLTAEERLQRPKIPLLGHRGSAMYDALASALCHMRTAKNVRQAIVVISDGMDQHSRLKLEQLTELVRSSNPQVFMVGLYDRPEYEVYRQSHKTVTIVGLREVDNPVVVFERLAKESGAESFFPVSAKDFKKALDRIAAMLSAQYLLAYYPERVDKVRRIGVEVNRKGIKISARRTVGSESPAEAVHFAATGCGVSPKDHRYPWESRVTSDSGSPMVYHEDFSDPRSGWPIRSYENMHSGAHYTNGGYQIEALPKMYILP
jgi:Ca-activated chloride channel homolog